jgi:hypothetical protein
MDILSGERLLEEESRKCFEYFRQEANTNKASPGYGLIRDRAPGNPRVCSVAAVGFGLAALAVGAERGWISAAEARERTLGTLHTLLYKAEQRNGFFFHFLDMNTAKRYWQSEVSVIDTAIALCGAITAAEYFRGEVAELAEKLYHRVNWEWYRDPAVNLFYMSYLPESDFSGHWDIYAEQLMMYFLGAASPTNPVNPDMFYSFSRCGGRYGRCPSMIPSFFGSLFTYQFSHAWFDLRGKRDRVGVDWWGNSIVATLANRQYCMDHAGKFKTFGPDSWGLTACDGPYGYSGGYGAPPGGMAGIHGGNDGTVAPCGAAGSIVFTPQESIAALEHYYCHFPDLWGRYGFRDAYNLDISPAWFAQDVIGIDKGISLLMIENYRTGFVWEVFMANEYAQKGMWEVGLTGMDTSDPEKKQSGAA